ncbi:hypothetical protein ABGV42_01160 [Paenibacillus pabuli]|uniref:hypothetical protein n=1 Tax=Paenibacillus pabuli TaxID=1472 RepID=UPI003242F365
MSYNEFLVMSAKEFIDGHFENYIAERKALGNDFIAYLNEQYERGYVKEGSDLGEIFFANIGTIYFEFTKTPLGNEVSRKEMFPYFTQFAKQFVLQAAISAIELINMRLTEVSESLTHDVKYYSNIDHDWSDFTHYPDFKLAEGFESIDDNINELKEYLSIKDEILDVALGRVTVKEITIKEV